MLKRLAFWMPLAYLLVGLLNLSGEDDKNILLFITSPPFWLAEFSWAGQRFMQSAASKTGVIIVVTLVFWCLVGMLIDWVIRRTKNKMGSGVV